MLFRSGAPGSSGSFGYAFAPSNLTVLTQGPVHVAFEGSSSSGAYLPLQVALSNQTKTPQAVELTFNSRGSQRVSVYRHFDLEPGDARSATLPVPSGVYGGEVSVQLASGVVERRSFNPGHLNGPTFWAVGTEAQF